MSEQDAVPLRNIRVEDIDAHGSHAVFYLNTVYDKARSQEEGKPCYKDVPYIEVRSDHDNKTVWKLPVKQNHKERWFKGWERFEQGIEGEAPGTPLETWAALPPARCRELQSQGFLAIEQLANCPDDRLPLIGVDAQQLREAAESYLRPADAETLWLRNENEDMKRQIAELQGQFRQLQNQRFGEAEESDAPLPPPVKRKPRRPRKAA